MYFGISIVAILMIVLFAPNAYSAKNKDWKQKKNITYTKKEMKTSSSAKKTKTNSSSASSSSNSSSTSSDSSSSLSVENRILDIFKLWQNCDAMSEKESRFSFEECSSGRNSERLREGHFAKDFTIEFSYGIENASWSPGSDETENQDGIAVANLLGYQTEGFILQRSDFQLSYLNKPFISFLDERPFIPSENQEKLMQIRKKNTSSNYKKYTYSIQLTPLLEMFEVESKIFNFVLSYRYQVNYEAFLGEAKALDDLEYLQKDASFSSNENGAFVESGAISITKGEKVSFKTLFRNEEHAFDLTQIWGPTRLPIYIGVFNNKWERPSDNKRAIEIEGNPVAFDTVFFSRGILLEFGPRFPVSEGFKISAKFKTGFDNRIENAALDPLNIDFSEDFENLLYQETDIKIWYNYILSPGVFKGDEIFFSLGYHYNSRVWEFVTSFDDGSREITEADKDVIHKFYTQLRYLF